jgi:lactoylglutathione lyase
MLATTPREGDPLRLVHTNVRVRDIDASLRFHEALGFERRGRLQFEGAYNIYLGLPRDSDTLELMFNEGRAEPYDSAAATATSRSPSSTSTACSSASPRRASSRRSRPTTPGGRTEYRICFVADPDGYRIELIDGDFATPQDPDR